MMFVFLFVFIAMNPSVGLKTKAKVFATLFYLTFSLIAAAATGKMTRRKYSHDKR